MRKIVPKPTFNNSPAVNAHHKAPSPKIMGNKKAKPIWKIKVLHNEIIAEIAPLLSAVKKEETNIE